MKQKEAMNYIEQFLAENNNFEFDFPERIDNILETTERKIWNNEYHSLLVFTVKGYDHNKNIVYQNIVKLNEKEIYVDGISNKTSLIYFCNQVLFLVNEQIISIPLYYILMSSLDSDPYNILSNALYKVKKEEDIKYLVMNKEEIKSISLNLLKFQNKLNIHLFEEKLYNIADLVISISFLLSTINDFKGIATIGAVSLTTLIFQLYNHYSISKCVKINQKDIATLIEYSLVLENIISFINTRRFKISNNFSIIKERINNVLLQNEHLRLYFSNTKGYLSDKMLCQTSLFINDIELWHGDYEHDEIPVVVFDNCIYILKGEGIVIPFAYILESIYEDNPVDAINLLVEKEKIKKLKR